MPFELVPQYPPFPECKTGACWVCSAQQRVKPGGQLEAIVSVVNKSADDQDGLYGGIYICEACVADMAHLVGFSTEEEAERAFKLAAEATAENDFLRERVSNLEDALHRLVVAGYEEKRATSKLLQCDYCEKDDLKTPGAKALHERNAHREEWERDHKL